MRVTTRSSLAGVLSVRIEGEFDPAGSVAAYSGALAEAARLGVGRILLDCRGLRGAPTGMQRYDFGLAVASLHAEAVRRGGPPVQVALIGSAPLLDPRRFGETVAINRGAEVRACDTAEQAAAWLGVDPAALGLAGDQDAVSSPAT